MNTVEDSDSRFSSSLLYIESYGKLVSVNTGGEASDSSFSSSSLLRAIAGSTLLQQDLQHGLKGLE